MRTGEQTKKKQPHTSKNNSKKNGAERNHLVYLVAVLAVAFFALSPILKNEFINYDDDIYVTQNPLIQNLGVPQVKTLFTDYYLNQYSPVAMVIAGLEFKISNNSFFIKLISILLHLLATVLLYKLLQLLFKRYEYVIITTALFALHPLQVESIAWTAASIKIGTYAAFFLGSLLFYVLYLEKKRMSYFLVSVLLFLCSLFSKEQAIVLSVVLLAIDHLKGRSLLLWRVWLEKIPYFILSFIFGVVTLKASSGGSQNMVIVSYTLLEKLIIANYSVVVYMTKLVMPLGLSAFYTFPLKDNISSIYYIALAGLPILVYSMYIGIKHKIPLLTFGVLFFLINLGLPTLSQLMGARDVMMADRYLYLPSIGFFLLLVFGLLYVKDKFKLAASTVYVIFIVYGLFLSVTTYSRSKVWHDSISVFSDVIEKGKTKEGKYSPFLSLAFNNRGIALKKQQKYDEALRDYNTAIEINPKDAKSYVNRGNINFDRRNLKEAIADYNTALEIDDNNSPAHASRGCSYAMLGDYDFALKDLNKALEINPNATDAYLNRSLVYFNNGKYKESLLDMNKYLSINTSDYSSYGQRGLIYLNMREFNNALQDMTLAINNSNQPGVHYLNRSLVYKELGNKSAALDDALKAKQSGMQVGQDYLNTLK